MHRQYIPQCGSMKGNCEEYKDAVQGTYQGMDRAVHPLVRDAKSNKSFTDRIGRLGEVYPHKGDDRQKEGEEGQGIQQLFCLNLH